MGTGTAGFTNAYQKPLGYQQITLSALSTLSPPSGATSAVIAVETAGIRWRDDGTAPTASIGMPVALGQTFSYQGNLSAIQFIAQSGTPVIDVSYYA